MRKISIGDKSRPRSFYLPNWSGIAYNLKLSNFRKEIQGIPEDPMTLDLVYIVDDSRMAITMAGRVLNDLGVRWKAFGDAKEIMFYLEQIFSTDKPDLPLLLLIDQTMPGSSGTDLLREIVRHPKWHILNTALLTVDTSDSLKKEATRLGALTVFSKPLQMADIQKLINKLHVPDWNSRREIEKQAGAEGSQRIREIQDILRGEVKEGWNKVKRETHTLKGQLLACGYTLHGNYIHEVEDFMRLVESNNLIAHAQCRKLLEATFVYLEEQFKQIQNGLRLDEIDRQLLQQLSSFSELVQSGWLNDLSFGSIPNRQLPKKPSPVSNEGSGHGHGVSEIFKEHHAKALDSMEKSVLKILAGKNRLRLLATQLKSEFGEESFPDDVLKIVLDIEAGASDLSYQFHSIKSVKVLSLHGFAKLIFDKAKVNAEIPIEFGTSIDPFIEVDPKIYALLELSLMHFINNSVAHGFTGADLKVSQGKIFFEIRALGSDKLRLFYSDNGKGINAEALKQKALSSVESGVSLAIENLSQKQILELIFLDGLSSQSEASLSAGRGMGLAAVKAGIEDVKGQVSVESSPHQGVQFVVELPLALIG